MAKKLPERREPNQDKPREWATPRGVKPSNDTSRDVMPPGWRRGLIPKGE